jgi:hypothetical protein
VVKETKWTRYWADKRAERTARLPENQGKHGHLGKEFGVLGKDFGHLGAADRTVNVEGGKLGKQFGELGKDFGELGAADRKVNTEGGKLGKDFGQLGAADRKVNTEGGKLGKQFGHLGAADPELNLLGTWRANAPRSGLEYCTRCGAPAGQCRHVPQRYLRCWCGLVRTECGHAQPSRQR